MANEPQFQQPIPLRQAARCLRVPARWLRDEVESGRIPALVAGRAILVHVPTASELLADRAKVGKAVRHAQ
jgi:hypothetical protein